MRVVVDTNVVVSAFLRDKFLSGSRRGNEALTFLSWEFQAQGK